MFWLKYKLSFIDSICQLPLDISLTCTWVYKSKQKNDTEIKVYGATRYKLKSFFSAKLTASHMLSIELNLEYSSK